MPDYRLVPQEEFYTRYNALADPFSLSLFFQMIEDKNPGSFFIINKENGQSLLHEAAKRDDLEFLKLLIKMGHDINYWDNEYKTPLYDACSRLNVNSVNELLYHGADPNLGNSDQILQGNRYDDGSKELVNYQGETVPLVATIDSITTLAFEQLTSTLNQPYTGDFSDLTIDHSSEQKGALIVRELISRGVNVNLQTGPDHFSALHRVVTYKYTLLLQELIRSGQANPYLIDRDGETALHIVANYRSQIEKSFQRDMMQKEKEIAELMIQYLDTLEIQETKFGNTPLHTAVIRSNEFVVKLLYQKDYLFQQRKLLSIPNKAGNTAIHEAVKAARRGPNILKLLLRVATNDELAIANYEGKTAKDIAENLLQESTRIDSFIQKLKTSEKKLDRLMDRFGYRMSDLRNLNDGTIHKIFEWQPLTTDQLIQLKETVNNLGSALTTLKNNAFFNDAMKDFEIIEDINRLSLHLKNFEKLASSQNDHSTLIEAVDNYHCQTLKVIDDINNNFLDKNFLESLTSVRQEEYFSWKNQILTLPSSFPNLMTMDSYSEAYQTDHIQASLYLSSAQEQVNKNNYNDAKENINAAIEIYHRLNAYGELENAYQLLAKITLSQGLSTIAAYEAINLNKVQSLDQQEKLQGHLALATLYNELMEQAIYRPSSLSFSLSTNTLYTLMERKSYYFYQTYKMTQGPLDNTAHTVLQRELGIAHNAPLGTYNIQQCIAVVAFDPISKKVVLSHFDKFSGPLSFIDQLLREFPKGSKIDLYLSGARDRFTPASSTSTISDNNIEQVLKQIYAEKDRFVIKSSDLGDKPSPEAIVFDVESQRLIHAAPNFPDTSLESREVNFQLQWVKGDYLRPLNRVDFSKNEVTRKINFSFEEQKQIHEQFLHYEKVAGQTEAWNHQRFYPLLALYNEQIGITAQDSHQALRTPLVKSGIVIHINENDLDSAGLSVEQRNNDIIRDSAIDMDGMIHLDFDPEQLPCLEGTKRKRAAQCIIDSELLLNYLKNLNLKGTSTKILNYLSSWRRIGGTKKEEVARLMHHAKIMTHLNTVNRFSSRFVGILLSEKAIVNLFSGDPTAAINLATFTGSNHLFLNIAKRLDKKATRLLAAGKNSQARILRTGVTPVIRRGTGLLIAYDFYEQIKALKKDSHNTEAWIGVGSDGLLLTTDVLGMGIEMLELSSEAIAALGLSALLNPIADVIGVIVILGTQIYEAVKQVSNENRYVQLTDWEKFKEGWRAFLEIKPQAYLQTMIEESAEYERLLAEQFDYIKNFAEISYFVFPAIKKNGTACKLVDKPCENVLFFIPQKHCLGLKEVCGPSFKAIADNSVYFKQKRAQSELSLSRERILPPSGSQLLCLPTTKDGVPPPPEIVFRCDAALGLNITNNTLGNTALYDLGEGKDYAFGFDDISNIFIVNNGAKRYAGGYQADTFIVAANKIVSANYFGKRGLDGKGGIDTLDLREFKPEKKVTINLNKGFLSYSNSRDTLDIKHIENLVCGQFPLSIITGYDTRKIEIAGGSTFEKADTIFVPKNSTCHYTTIFYLKPYSTLNNTAQYGDFTYTIQSGSGMISVNLTLDSNTTFNSYNASHHQFVFDVDISDLYVISSSKKVITFHFSEHKVNKLFRTLKTITLAKSNTSNNEINFDYQFNSNFFLSPNDLDLLPKVIQSNASRKKLTALLHNESINDTLIIHDRNTIHQILFNFVGNSGFILNNFKLEIIYSELKNIFFQFVDGTEIKITNDTHYLFFTGSQKNITDIIAFYSPIARRLNMLCNIKTFQNQRVIIGHHGRQVVYNDKYAFETHLYSSGQGLFVLQPSLPPLFSTLNDVILHRDPFSRAIDTLDFRQLKAKIETGNGLPADAITLIILSQNNIHEFQFLTRKQERTLENDLLLLLATRVDYYMVIDYIAVRLKDALLTHWYENYLQIILNVAPLKIVGNLPNFTLQPLPLRIDEIDDFITLGIEDVEENTEIIIPRESDFNTFYQHNKTNLIFTNTLTTSNTMKPFTIVLENFYNEPQLETLSFTFSNKKIVLSKKLTDLNRVENFEQAKRKKDDILEKESRAILRSQSIQPTQSTQKKSELTTSTVTKQRRSLVKSLTKNAPSTFMFTPKDPLLPFHFFTSKPTYSPYLKHVKTKPHSSSRVVHKTHEVPVMSSATRPSHFINTFVNTLKIKSAAWISTLFMPLSQEKTEILPPHFYEIPILENVNNLRSSLKNDVEFEYPGHVVSHVYFAKWLFGMFGKHSVVHRMNQAERASYVPVEKSFNPLIEHKKTLTGDNAQNDRIKPTKQDYLKNK